MRLNLKLLAAVALVTAAALAVVTASQAGTPELSTYRVTLVNLTSGQPFSPPVAATHQKTIRMFEVGELASDQLAAIAQAGDEGPMFRRFSASDKVTQTVDVARPLTPSGRSVGGFTDTVTFEIAAAPGDRFSLATMLICTNDGFLGLDAVKLPKHGPEDFFLAGYDAGREENTEQSEDLVDPCSALGPAPLRGDPNGNRDSGPGITTSPAEAIQHHPGIAGIADLSVAAHGWTDPVAKATIERIG
jgi:hypothetical protein